MDALQEKYPEAYPEATDVPSVVAPAPLKKLAVRWNTDILAAIEDGAPLLSFMDVDGRYTLDAPQASQRPTVRSGGGHKYLRFNGAVSACMQAFTLPAFQTVVGMFRISPGVADSTPQSVFSLGGSGTGLIRSNAGSLSMGMFFGGTPARSTTFSNAPAGVWKPFAVRNITGDAKAQVGAASTSSAAAADVAPSTSLNVALRGTAYGSIDLSDIATLNWQPTDEELLAWTVGLATAKASLIAA